MVDILIVFSSVVISIECDRRLFFVEWTGQCSLSVVANALRFLAIRPFLWLCIWFIDLSDTLDLETGFLLMTSGGGGVFFARFLGWGQSMIFFSLTYKQHEITIPNTGITLIPSPTAPRIIRWSLMWFAIGLMQPWN